MSIHKVFHQHTYIDACKYTKVDVDIHYTYIQTEFIVITYKTMNYIDKRLCFLQNCYNKPWNDAAKTQLKLSQSWLAERKFT